MNKLKGLEYNEDWNICIDQNSLTLGRCVYECKGNESCQLDCAKRFDTRQLECPCEVQQLLNHLLWLK